MKVSTENDNNFGYEKKYDCGRQYAFKVFWDKIPFLLNTIYIIQEIKFVYNYYPCMGYYIREMLS